MSQRRTVAAATAVVLLLEGVVLGVLHWVLAVFVQEQRMSLDGLAPGTLALVSRVAGVLLGGYLALCALLVLRAALRDRAPGRFARWSLVACAITHGVLGVLAVALVGWGAFAALMAILALLVWTLLGYAPPETSERGPREPSPQPQPAG